MTPSITIAWFSGTGNSLAVARGLAEHLDHVRLAPITRLLAANEVNPRCQRLDLVFPVYSWGMPEIVARFVERVALVHVDQVFAVATCGGSAGGTLESLDRALRGQGRHLDAGFTVTMPGNCTPLYGAPAPARLEAAIASADERVARIADQLRTGSGLAIERDLLPARWLSHLLYPLFRSQVHASDRRFRVTHRCTGCGLCQRICPVGNIELDPEKGPQWHHRCQFCLACLQWCPVEAIQYWRLTRGVRRYRHPRVTSADLAEQQPGATDRASESPR